KALRTVQPSGPYFLGGWSLGGVIAYEMARQLRASGETVALLALIDSFVPNFLAQEPEPDRMQLALMFARDLMGVSLDPDLLAGLEPEAVLERLLQQATRAGALPPGTSPEQVRTLFHVFEANLRASQRYQAPASTERVVLFKAKDGPSEDGGWSTLVGTSLERHLLPGDHYTLLRQPGVRELAERLREALKKAR
ncbi:thioesterase domain-containing protein, partial [Pyxidicoccus sp. 3LG]